MLVCKITKESLVVVGSLVQHLCAVLLGSDWRWQVDGDHRQECVASGQPRLHDDLEQRLAALHELFLFLDGYLDVELLDELQVLLLAEVHDAREDLEDGVEHELVEAARVSLAALGGPLLLAGAVEVVAPEALHELGHLDLELGRVDLGELLERERPAMEAGAEAHCALRRVDLDVAHRSALVAVGGDDDVDALDNALKGLEEILLLELELEESAVHLVHEEDGLDALGNGLTQHGLRLHAHARHAVDDDEGAVSDAQSGRDL